MFQSLIRGFCVCIGVITIAFTVTAQNNLTAKATLPPVAEAASDANDRARDGLVEGRDRPGLRARRLRTGGGPCGCSPDLRGLTSRSERATCNWKVLIRGFGAFRIVLRSFQQHAFVVFDNFA